MIKKLTINGFENTFDTEMITYEEARNLYIQHNLDEFFEAKKECMKAKAFKKYCDSEQFWTDLEEYVDSKIYADPDFCEFVDKNISSEKAVEFVEMLS